MCFPGRICLSFEPLSRKPGRRWFLGAASGEANKPRVAIIDWVFLFSLPELGLLAPLDFGRSIPRRQVESLARVAQSGVAIRSSSTPCSSYPFLVRGRVPDSWIWHVKSHAFKPRGSRTPATVSKAAPQWQRVWTELNETHSWAKGPFLPLHFLSPFHFCLYIYARTSPRHTNSPLLASLGFSIRGHTDTSALDDSTIGKGWWNAEEGRRIFHGTRDYNLNVVGNTHLDPNYSSRINLGRFPCSFRIVRTWSLFQAVWEKGIISAAGRGNGIILSRIIFVPHVYVWFLYDSNRKRRSCSYFEIFENKSRDFFKLWNRSSDR